MRLVLWDIDGTLVQAGEVGRDIFNEAFQAVLGRDPDRVTARALAMAARTDPEIALEVLAAPRPLGGWAPPRGVPPGAARGGRGGSGPPRPAAGRGRPPPPGPSASAGPRGPRGRRRGGPGAGGGAARARPARRLRSGTSP